MNNISWFEANFGIESLKNIENKNTIFGKIFQKDGSFFEEKIKGKRFQITNEDGEVEQYKIEKYVHDEYWGFPGKLHGIVVKDGKAEAFRDSAEVLIKILMKDEDYKKYKIKLLKRLYI